MDSSNAPDHPASNTSSTSPNIQLEHGLVPSAASGSLMQELLGGGGVDGLNGFQGMNPMALQALMSSFSNSNYTAQIPFSPNAYYSMMGSIPASSSLPPASPNMMGMPMISPLTGPTFPADTAKVLASEPAVANAQDKARILQDPAVAAMLREMIQEGVEQGLARTKTSSGGGTGIRKQRDGDMEDEVQTTMLGLLGISKSGRQAFKLPDPLPADAPRRLDKQGKVLYNPDWTAKAQASINVEFRAVATALIMQNKKLSDDAKSNVETRVRGYFERLKEVYAQQINPDARSKSIHRKINTRCRKRKKAKATALREVVPKLKEKHGAGIDGIEQAILTDCMSDELTDAGSRKSGRSQQKQLKIKRPAWRNKRLERLYSALRKLSVEEGGTQVHSRVVDNTDMDTDARPPRFTYKAWVSKTWFQSQTQDIVLKDNAADMPILSFHIPDEDLDEDDIGRLADDEADDLE